MSGQKRNEPFVGGADRRRWLHRAMYDALAEQRGIRFEGDGVPGVRNDKAELDKDPNDGKLGADIITAINNTMAYTQATGNNNDRDIDNLIESLAQFSRNLENLAKQNRLPEPSNINNNTPSPSATQDVAMAAQAIVDATRELTTAVNALAKAIPAMGSPN